MLYLNISYCLRESSWTDFIYTTRLVGVQNVNAVFLAKSKANHKAAALLLDYLKANLSLIKQLQEKKETENHNTSQ